MDNLREFIRISGNWGLNATMLLALGGQMSSASKELMMELD